MDMIGEVFMLTLLDMQRILTGKCGREGFCREDRISQCTEVEKMCAIFDDQW
jgi:hypothetical protein